MTIRDMCTEDLLEATHPSRGIDDVIWLAKHPQPVLRMRGLLSMLAALASMELSAEDSAKADAVVSILVDDPCRDIARVALAWTRRMEEAVVNADHVWAVRRTCDGKWVCMSIPPGAYSNREHRFLFRTRSEAYDCAKRLSRQGPSHDSHYVVRVTMRWR